MSIIPQASKVYTGFTPTSIPNCILWLDAADSSSVTLSGSNVTSWRDKALQSTATNVAGTGPTISSINSVQALYFDGTKIMSVGLSGSTTNRTFFMVMNSTSTNGAFIWPISNNGFEIQSYNSTSLVFSNQGIAYIRISPTIPTNQPYLLTISFSGAPSTIISINGAGTGTDAGQTTGSSLLSDNGHKIGGNTGFTSIFTLGEIVEYNSTLTTSQRQQVEGYLARKWGLTTNLPAAHPFKLTPIVSRPFQPIDIAGCGLWLDGADPSYMTLSGTSVTVWQDKSGNARNFTASGAAANYNGGLTGLLFNSNRYTSSFSAVVTNETLFTVFKPTSNISMYVLASSADGGRGVGTYGSASSYGIVNANVAWGSVASNQLLGTNSVNIGVTVVSGGNSTQASANGNSLPTATTFSAFSGSGTTQLGMQRTNESPFYGTIYEIVGYSQVLTTSEIRQVEGYLANKWGIRSNIPSTHPYKIVPAITVPFSPINISGLRLWLDAADPNGTGIAPANNTVITTWVDKSGNAKNATATNGASYVTNGINKFGALYFDGTLYRGYANNSLLITNNTVFAFVIFVSSMNSGSEGMRLLAFNSTTNGVGDYNSNNTGIMFIYDTNRMQTYRNNTFTTNLTCPAVGTPILSTTYYNGSIAYNSLNGGTSVGAMGFNANFNTTNGYVFANGNINMKGYIGEIILYNSLLTTTQQQQVEGYLAAKWGIQGNILSTHPFKRIPP